MVGILSVDLSLTWFSKMVTEAKPFPHSYNMLIGKGGTYLVHPDSTKQFYETIFTSTLDQPDTAKVALGKAMIAGKSGYKVLHGEKEDEYVFYRPLSHTDWSVAIVCPESDIFEPYYRLQNNLLFITIVGLLLLLFFCVFVIRSSLRPLKQLGQAAERMSEGHFEEVVPDSSRRDEIGQLQRSFFKMQRFVSEYIGKIRHSTEMLTERNEELLKASEMAKEDDRMKTAVLNNMTDQMVQPVDVIAAESDLIRKEYKNYSEEEMAEHVDRMLACTEEVTSLLNQLLDASQNTVDKMTNEAGAETPPTE